jgi:uncharacterized protein YjbI with pentapeptide repeats
MLGEFIHIDKTFDKLVLMDQKISNREFDGCVFRHCDFSNSAFVDCTFIDCEFLIATCLWPNFPEPD